MNKGLGYFYRGVGKIIDYTVSLLIYVVDFLINLFSSFRQILGLLFSMSGCLIFLLLFSPSFFRLTFGNPILGPLIILMFVVPILGRIVVSYLKYIHYMGTEYFYDKADFYLLGRTASYEKMQDYGRKYREKLEAERLRREQERRKRQQEEFERNFGNFGNFGGGTYWTFGGAEDFEEFFRNAQNQGYGGYQGGYSNQGGQSYNPSAGFKDQYEKACDVLGVSYSADKYEIKLQYKKMAKMYHPDLNKEAGATEKFQKINTAYEFLNDSNIQRYKNLQ